MNVKDIVIDYLEKNGYDGLCNPSIECGCGLDDFIPCGEMGQNCEAAYKTDCETCYEATGKTCDDQWEFIFDNFSKVKCWEERKGGDGE